MKGPDFQSRCKIINLRRVVGVIGLPSPKYVSFNFSALLRAPMYLKLKTTWLDVYTCVFQRTYYLLHFLVIMVIT